MAKKMMMKKRDKEDMKDMAKGRYSPKEEAKETKKKPKGKK